MKTLRTLANGDVRPIGAQAPNAGKPRRRGFAGAWQWLLAGLLAGLVGCSSTPPETALRANLAAMQAAAEARDTDAVMEHVADDFIGPQGMDALMLRRSITASMFRYREVGVTLGPLEIAVQGDRARVAFTAATTGGQGWLPDSGRVYRVETGWRLQGEAWLLVSANWE